MKEISYLHIIHTLISDSFGVVKSCGLREEGRRDKEEGLKGLCPIRVMSNFDFLYLVTSWSFYLAATAENFCK